MTDYIHHTDGVIDVASKRLPAAWRNVSGLDRASSAELKAMGWLPVVESKPTFDPTSERLTGPTGVSIGDAVARGADSVTAVWVATPYTAPVPASVTPLQARRVLRAQGLTATVEAWVADQGAEVAEAWEYAQEIRRDDALITAVGAALDLTEDQIDNLFRAAYAETTP